MCKTCNKTKLKSKSASRPMASRGVSSRPSSGGFGKPSARVVYGAKKR